MRIFEINSLPPYNSNIDYELSNSEMSERQKHAIDFYINHGYAKINSHLRGVANSENTYTYDNDDEMKKDLGYVMSYDEAITHIDNLMALSNRSKTIKVFRSESNHSRAEYLYNMNVGFSYVEQGYLSTSTRPAYGFYAFAQPNEKKNNIVSMYIVPPSVGGIMVNDVEKEFIIDRNSTYTLREKRIIPNEASHYAVKEIRLLIWDVK